MKTIEMMSLNQIIIDIENEIKRDKVGIRTKERRLSKLKEILEPNEKAMHDRFRKALNRQPIE